MKEAGRAASPQTQREIRHFEQSERRRIRRIVTQLREGRFSFGVARGPSIQRPGKRPRPVVVSEIGARVVQRAISSLQAAVASASSDSRLWRSSCARRARSSAPSVKASSRTRAHRVARRAAAQRLRTSFTSTDHGGRRAADPNGSARHVRADAGPRGFVGVFRRCRQRGRPFSASS